MRTWICSSICALALVAFTAGSAVAQTAKGVAVLYGGDIAPTGVLTGAVGLAEFTVDVARGEVSFEVNLFNLSTRVTAVHVHVGSIGVGGPIVFDLRPTSQSGDFDVTGTLRATDVMSLPDLGIRTAEDAVQALFLGATYIDVHTERNPDGELRGQIFPTDVQAQALRALVRRFVRAR